MFSFFKKKNVQPEPHPLKVHFAKTYLPVSIQDMRSGFVNAMASPDAVGILSRAWSKFGLSNLTQSQMIEPVGMDVNVFREGNQILIVVTLPTPSCKGEPYYAAAVIGPTETGEWDQAAVDAAPYRYFVAVATEAGTEIEELSGDSFSSQGPGPEPDLHLFIEWVLNAAVRDSSIVSVRSEDEEMEQAIANARATLPNVIERFIAGELQAFTVKVRVSDGQNSEHFWLSNTEYNNGVFVGTIEAQAQRVSGITEGQVYEAPIEAVTDWMHLRGGQMHGNYTLRVLLPKMPQEEARKYAAHLAPLG
jgi:uncharacterized protein YegJ (DUF2314 family)